MTDNELILLIAQGDEAAFRQLYEAYKDKVYNTALYQLASQEDAEEVTQDVFVEVFRSAAGFKGAALVSTWIYRIVINKSLDKLRGRQRKKRSLVSFLFGDLDDGLQPVDFHHPGVAAEQRESHAQLFAAINSLSSNQKAAFILTYVEDLPQREVSEILGLKLKALESLLQRAKQSLRKELGDRVDAPRRNQAGMTSKLLSL